MEGLMGLRKSQTKRGLDQRQGGQSMVEMAFLLLPFLLISIGVIELGRWWTIKQAITNAAREGARVLVLPYGQDRLCPGIDCTSAASVQVAAFQATQNYLVNTGVSVAPESTSIELLHQWVDGGGVVQTETLSTPPVTGDFVGIRIRYRFSSSVNALFTGTNDLMSMTATAVMRHE